MPSNADGEPAVWVVAPNQHLDESSTGFIALVSRLGCNNGVTGRVLPPEIRLHESEVVVTFSVAPKQPGAARCQGNDQVRYEVDIGEPLEERALVDGECLAGEEARRTAACASGSARFRS